MSSTSAIESSLPNPSRSISSGGRLPRVLVMAVSASLVAGMLGAAAVRAGTGYTATTDGSWADAATWGGATPPITSAEGDSIAIPTGVTVTIPSGIVVDLNSTNLTVSGSLLVHGEIHAKSTSTITAGGAIASDGLVSIEGGYNLDQTVFGTARLVVAGSASITGGTLAVRPFSELRVNSGGLLQNDATTSLGINTTTTVQGTLDNAGELGLDFVQSFRPFNAVMLVQGGTLLNRAGAHVQLDGTIGLGASADLSQLENRGVIDLPRSNSGRGHLVSGSGLTRIDNYGTINIADSVINTAASNTIWNHEGGALNVELQTRTAGDLLGTLTVGPGLVVNDGAIANSGVVDNSGGGRIDNLCNGSITGNAVAGAAPTDACDLTAPAVAASFTGTQGTNGWYTSNVGIAWTITEPEGHVASATGCGPSTVVIDTTGSTATCTVVSYGGTTSQSITVKRDATAPSASADASPGPNPNGWNSGDVTVTFSGSDATSGVASCSPPVTLTAEAAGQQAAGTCTDGAGNVSAPASVIVAIDRTAPGASLAVDPLPNQVGWNNTPVTVSWSGSDGLSGIEACSTPMAVSVEGTTSPSGTCTDLAGNVSASVGTTILIDLTAPTITFTNNAGHYGLLDVVAIGCAAADTLSGIATSSCPTASGPAWSFALGTPNTLDASATDVAGNPSLTSTSFTVDVTASGVHDLIDTFTTDRTIGPTLHKLFDAVVTAKPSQQAAKVKAFAQYALGQAGRGDLTVEEANVLVAAVKAFAAAP